MEVEVEGIKNQELEKEIRAKLASAGEGLYALGQLGDMALQIGLIQQSCTPHLLNPSILVFAGDHGIVEEGVSVHPQKLTHQKVLDYLNGTSPLNRVLQGTGLHMKMVDVGVNNSFEGTLTYWLHQGSKLFNRKIGYGSNNFLEYPALTTAQMEKAMQTGLDMVDFQSRKGSTVVGLADLGVGSTTSASAVCAALTDSEPLEYFIKGSIRSEEQLAHKQQVIEKALRKHPKTHDPLTILTIFGGFEIAAIVGAMLRAAEKRMLILVDGFVSASAVLLASQVKAEVRDYCIFCSSTNEPGYQNLLKELNAKALVNLDVQAGEGVGIALAYPLVEKAVDLLSGFSAKE